MPNWTISWQPAVFLPVPLATVDDADLLQPRRLKSVLLLVNVGVDPLRHHSQMNLHMATGRTDVLGYAGVRDNLVLTSTSSAFNSWNELDGAPRRPPGAASSALPSSSTPSAKARKPAAAA